MVGHGADTANGRTCYDDITVVKRTVLNQNRRYGAATLIQLCLDDNTLGAAVGVRLELLDLGNEQNALEQLVDALTRQCRDGYAHDVASPLLGNEVVLGQLLLDLIGVGGGLIHLVDGNDDVDARRFCMVDGLNGLRHDAVVCGDDQNGDIGRLCTAGTHGGKRLVTGRVKEGNILTVDFDTVCTDVLGDTARLTCRNARVTDGVEQ